MASSSSALQAGKKILVLGGTGYLGQTVCQVALDKGYNVVSLSRRGLPPSNQPLSKVDYRQGDARKMESVSNILQEGDFCGVVHCIGLLFDDQSGLGNFNRFVSGSGSLPDSQSTYDSITRITAFNAIDATIEYAQENQVSLPFCFTSAAEAGWPEVTGGPLIESLMPDFIRRYMKAKRAVEAKLLASESLRPIIVRPSLIFSWNKWASLPAVGTFAVANKLGLPFVDRPVTVDNLARAVVKAMEDTSVQGKLRFREIDTLGQRP